MLSFLTRWFSRQSIAEELQESEWATVRLPRVGRKHMSFEQAEARLVLGALRLALSRMHPDDLPTKMKASARMEECLARFVRDDQWAGLDEPSLLAMTLAEVRERIDPGALHALQRWYRLANEKRTRRGEDGFTNTMVAPPKIDA